MTYNLRFDYFLHAQVHTHIHTHTYVLRGHVWHRNKLASGQLELLVSCSDDEHQTSLKWDRSSHPVAPECRVSHTVRLKHSKINVWRPLEPFSHTSPWQLSGKQGVLPDLYDIKCIPEDVISRTNVELRDHIKVIYRTLCWNMFRASMTISNVHVLPFLELVPSCVCLVVWSV